MKKVLFYGLKTLQFALCSFMLYVIGRSILDNTYEINRVIEEVADLLKSVWQYGVIVVGAVIIHKEIDRVIKWAKRDSKEEL